mmetsp:Transcript_35012/g.98278  ORF Transcript_35012/g.98278 Transcript_35012/m.98278 type:complete len:265 (+) Transcript_35012:486-1280(+)
MFSQAFWEEHSIRIDLHCPIVHLVAAVGKDCIPCGQEGSCVDPCRRQRPRYVPLCREVLQDTRMGAGCQCLGLVAKNQVAIATEDANTFFRLLPQQAQLAAVLLLLGVAPHDCETHQGLGRSWRHRRWLPPFSPRPPARGRRRARLQQAGRRRTSAWCGRRGCRGRRRCRGRRGCRGHYGHRGRRRRRGRRGRRGKRRRGRRDWWCQLWRWRWQCPSHLRCGCRPVDLLARPRGPDLQGIAWIDRPRDAGQPATCPLGVFFKAP